MKKAWPFIFIVNLLSASVSAQQREIIPDSATTLAWHSSLLNKSIALEYLADDWSSFNKETPDKITPPNHVNVSPPQPSVYSPERLWREKISPPFPNAWPPTLQRTVSYYAFAEYNRASRDFGGVMYSAPWGRVILRDGDDPVKTIYLTEIGQPISGWCDGPLCVPPEPIDRQERERIFRGEQDIENALLNWTSLPDTVDPEIAGIRAFYCRWEYEHKKLVSDYIQKNHSDFFHWLACAQTEQLARERHDEFMDAVKMQDISAVKILLAAGYDPGSDGPVVGSSLGLALSAGNMEMFDLLLEHGAGRKLDDQAWGYLFAGAVIRDDFKVANRLFSMWVDPRDIDRALVYAKSNEMRDFLFSSDLHPGDKRSTVGRVNALMHAVEVGDDGAVVYLLQHVDYGTPHLAGVLIAALCPPQRVQYINNNSDQSYFATAKLLILAGAASQKINVPCKVRTLNQDFESFLQQHSLEIIENSTGVQY